MGRHLQTWALSFVCVFGYSSFASAKDADAAGVEKPADATGGTAEPPVPETTPAPPPAPPAPAASPEAPPPTTFDPFKIESKNATLKVGLLLQPQYEAIGSADAAHSGTSNNLFIRRTRLLVGGTLFGKFEYFFDTDAPNLFKGDLAPTGGMAPAPATGTKAGFGIGVQDAFATWKAYDDYLKLDAGYMLPPGAHNALQGAGTLFGLDYFSNSFLHSNAFNGGAPVGRDAGAQLRGLLADGRVEYRAGIFQGLRRPGTATDAAAQNMFRIAGRVQINFLDPETSFFYAGTYLGKKKILSVGAAYDFQSDYHHWAVDGFLDMPLGPGALTAQVDFSKWNGGGFVALPKETAFMAEAGYRFDAFPISPIVKYEFKNVVYDAAGTDESRLGGGVAFWPYGHTINVKAFYTHIDLKPAVGDSYGYNQFQLQWQLYFY